MELYHAKNDRYDKMIYRRVGNSGIHLPTISLALWQNFGFKNNLGSLDNLYFSS